MNRSLYRTCTWVLWLALPLTVLRYWQVWDRLPVRMATHFDLANHPNGWMTREVSFWFSLGLTAFLLAIFTAVLYVVQSKQGINLFTWGLLGLFYLVIGLVYSVNSGLIDYNLYGLPINLGPVIIPIAVGVLALIVIYLATQRGTPLPATDLIVEEVHAGRVWALFLGLPLIAEIWIAVITPLPGIRLGVALIGLVLLASAAMAYSGFHYCFSRHGLEIRTLGFRLRSIPASQIKEYSARRWNPLYGYGIRGVGKGRAYVWGNQGVRLKTSAGEVFLGHREPDRIVRDLDMMMGFSHS
jgi:Protein of unknown function (DUF1648)